MKLSGVRWALKSPKRLFVLDAIGALLSAFLLGFVLVAYQPTFGIPKPTLYLLATLPCLLAVYDGVGYITPASKTSLMLKGIALMNTAYCALSIGLAGYHWQEVTMFGWVYLVLEVLIVLGIARLEWRTARALMV